MQDNTTPTNYVDPDDPALDGQLPDDQTTLNDDYLQNSVQEAETEGTAAPEDTSSAAMDTSWQAVKDDMPGDDTAAAEHDLTSPNADSFNPRYVDTQDNNVADMTTLDNNQSVADAISEQEEKGDLPEANPNAEQRIG